MIFALLLSFPKWKAVALNGILFGSMHLIHVFMDKSWGAAVSQSAITSAAGMMLTAVRYATGSLWLTIVLHMLQNLSVIYSNVEIAAGPTALLIVRRLAIGFELVLAAYVVWNMQRGGRQTPSTPISRNPSLRALSRNVGQPDDILEDWTPSTARHRTEEVVSLGPPF